MSEATLDKLSKPTINIIWLKRDIRLADHEGFYLAEQADQDYIPLYIFDPDELAGPDSSLRHQQFVFHSLLDVNKQLEAVGRELIYCWGNSSKIFEFFAEKFSVKRVFSYQESGTIRTW
jgi:deoxyribodipyrimidine photo-lyase